MVENRPWLTFAAHAVLIARRAGRRLSRLHDLRRLDATTRRRCCPGRCRSCPGGTSSRTTAPVLFSGLGASSSSPPVALMMFNSLIMALAIALGKIAISIISAFAIVYFRFPFRMSFFWMIFVTLMLPVEVRILPTYEVVADLGMLNTYAGLTIPLIASATATFLFRQFFLTVPDELAEAARIDGAGPMRFFYDVLLPLSRTTIAALFVIQFIYGWNQYLWPLLVTTNEDMYTVVIGIKRMITGGRRRGRSGTWSWRRRCWRCSRR